MELRTLVDAILAGDLLTARQWVADAMREHHMRRSQADIVQVLNVAAARFAFDHLDFIFIFRSMRVN